jgi:hypothetical protein
MGQNTRAAVNQSGCHALCLFERPPLDPASLITSPGIFCRPAIPVASMPKLLFGVVNLFDCSALFYMNSLVYPAHYMVAGFFFNQFTIDSVFRVTVGRLSADNQTGHVA